MSEIQEKLKDLLIQATRERSHYYVASVVKEALVALAEKDEQITALESTTIQNGIIGMQREQIAALQARIKQLEQEMQRREDYIDSCLV